MSLYEEAEADIEKESKENKKNDEEQSNKSC